MTSAKSFLRDKPSFPSAPSVESPRPNLAIPLWVIVLSPSSSQSLLASALAAEPYSSTALHATVDRTDPSGAAMRHAGHAEFTEVGATKAPGRRNESAIEPPSAGEQWREPNTRRSRPSNFLRLCTVVGISSSECGYFPSEMIPYHSFIAYEA